MEKPEYCNIFDDNIFSIAWKTRGNNNMKKIILFFLLISQIFPLNISFCQSDITSKTKNQSSCNTILTLLYKHVKDDNGAKFGSGNDCAFMFEPNGILHLYIGSDSDAVSVPGTYEITGGKLHLRITDNYLPLDATIDFDIKKTQIIMPFRVLSKTNGTSTWEKVCLSAEDRILLLFNAMALDESGNTDESINKQINDWGNQVKDVGDPAIETITIKNNTVKIIYSNGIQSNIMLYSKNINVPYKKTKMGVLAKDPRTHLNVKSPKINEFDPIEKTALFAGPWNNFQFPVWKKVKGKWAIDYTKMADTFGRSDSLDVMADKMTKQGYKCKVLKNADADIFGLIENLLPGDGRGASPGMVYMSSHGDSEGQISVGTFWYSDTEWNSIKKELNDKYPSLLTYGGGTFEKPAVFDIYYLKVGWRIDKKLRNLFIKPLFWKWLNEHGADFSRSFVHIGACLIDQKPEFRENIKARALFCYNIAVPEDFCAASQRYFIECLSRPSRSAEEVYYNILRICTTEQLIYKEDLIFKGTLPDNGEILIAKGYGYDGGEIISYQHAGWWNSSNMNRGNVWYLLWAARWSQDVQKGWQALLDCWDSCWQYHKTGGIANTGCNNMSPGPVPTAEEVAYAGWLLKGEMTLSPPGRIDIVPRFTLKDGK